MVKFKIITITMIKVYGRIGKIIILTINNCEYGHDISHGHNLGLHHHNHQHYYAKYWLDPHKLVQPRLSHSWPVPSLLFYNIDLNVGVLLAIDLTVFWKKQKCHHSQLMVT